MKVGDHFAVDFHDDDDIAYYRTLMQLDDGRVLIEMFGPFDPSEDRRATSDQNVAVYIPVDASFLNRSIRLTSAQFEKARRASWPFGSDDFIRVFGDELTPPSDRLSLKASN